MKAFALITILAATPVLGVSAQSTGVAGFVLELPASTRALGMGDAPMIAESDASAIFYNAGLVTRGGGTSFSVQRYGAASTLTALSTSVSWGGGTLAFGFQGLQYGAPGLDPTAIAANEGLLFANGPNGASEYAGAVAYGRTVSGFRVGVSARALEQRLRDGTAGAVFADVGIARDIGPGAVGLSIRNVGPDLTLQGNSRPLPLNVTLNASLRRRVVGPLDIGGAAYLSRQQDGELEPGAGVEVSYWPVRGRTFTARAGVRKRPDPLGITTEVASPVSFGIGFTNDRVTIDYAVQVFNGTASAAHRVGVTIQ